jgi:hypothetical protein
MHTPTIVSSTELRRPSSKYSYSYYIVETILNPQGHYSVNCRWGSSVREQGSKLIDGLEKDSALLEAKRMIIKKLDSGKSYTVHSTKEFEVNPSPTKKKDINIVNVPIINTNQNSSESSNYFFCL